MEKTVFEQIQDKLDKLGASISGITLGENPGTPENVAKEILNALTEIEEFNSLPIHEQMRRDMSEIYKDLYKAFESKHEGNLSCAVDNALCMLGNWVPREVQKEVRKQFYPDDGGLKKQVRDISEVPSLSKVILDHFKQEGYHPDTISAIEDNLNDRK